MRGGPARGCAALEPHQAAADAADAAAVLPAAPPQPAVLMPPPPPPRLDICIYVQCMQRHSQSPRVEDIRKLNRLLRWVQKRPAGIVYFRRKAAEFRWRLSAVSDSAFRSLEENTTGLALRGFVVMLTVYDKEHPGGICVILDYGTKKHKRVNRSTFAAELNAAVDTVDVATVVQFTLQEIIDPDCSNPSVMQKRYDAGELPRDVYDEPFDADA